MFNTAQSGNAGASVATDRLFVIGNGIDGLNRSDALVMLKNGNTTLNGQLTIDADNTGSGVGYTLPGQDGAANQIMTTDGSGTASWVNVPADGDSDSTNEIELPVGGTNGQVLSTNGSGAYSWVNDATGTSAFSTTANVTSNTPGTIATDDFVFGSTQLDDIGGTNDDNIRMYFDKSKGAFRVGNPLDNFGESTAWNTSNTGDYSVAMGRYSLVQGTAAAAFGTGNSAGGENAFTAGVNNLASRPATIALGADNSVSGYYAVGLGRGSQATSYGQHTIGLFSDGFLSTDNNYVATDPLFVVGNGISDASRSNALVMRKNGNTTLNGQLTIDGDNTGAGVGYTLPAQDGAANQIMQTNGSGAVSWVNAPSDGDSDPTNEIELPVGGTNGQVLSTDGSGVYTWINAPSGGADNLGNHQASQDIFLQDNHIRLRYAGDTFHGMGWYGTYNSIVIDGPIITGHQGGGLGTNDATNNRLALSWDNNRNVTISEAYTLPNTDGTANQILQTNGSGTASWSSNVSATSVTTDALTVNNLPAFSADLDGTQVLSGAGTTSFSTLGNWRTSDAALPASLYDNGNHFNETTGEFTAPYNGFYYFTAQIRFDDITTGWMRLVFAVNGSLSLENGLHAIADGESGNRYQTLNIGGVLKLNANDTVSVSVNSATDTSWSIVGESGFNGYLISRF